MKESNNFLGKGRFLKQYFIDFPGGDKLHAWIFMNERNKLIYGHKMKFKNGKKDFYNTSNELDFFELPALEQKVTLSLTMVTFQAQAKMKVLEFVPGFDFNSQINAMQENNLDGALDFIEMQKRNFEINKLDKLWDINEEVKEDNSSADWLLKKIHEWEEANKNNGKTVEFFGAFFSFDSKESSDDVDSKIFAFGLKKSISYTLKEIGKEVKKSKDKFINW